VPPPSNKGHRPKRQRQHPTTNEGELTEKRTNATISGWKTAKNGCRAADKGGMTLNQAFEPVAGRANA